MVLSGDNFLVTFQLLQEGQKGEKSCHGEENTEVVTVERRRRARWQKHRGDGALQNQKI